ncbi:MAG TPA: YaaR family protein [Spirochaetales bacterium]|nr:YaaR family protein [Spirochaetales bacterium]HRY54853.1 YaaR family protein [Spirochaetia bacterium]
MARIEFPDGTNPLLGPLLPRRKEEERKVGKGRGLFGAVLGRAVEEARGQEGAASAGPYAGEPFSQEAIERLLDEVHDSGDRLKENPTVDLVQAYKKAVRDFVHYVVERAYAVEQKSSGRNVLKRNVYYRVSVIDESLERLAAEILRNQRDKLEILRRVDEINGMIVDLLR